MATTHLKQYPVSVADVVVGKLTGAELVEDDSVGVHIRLVGEGILLVHSNHLGRHPKERPRRLLTLLGALPVGLYRGQTKVANLHRKVVVKENVC